MTADVSRATADQTADQTVDPTAESALRGADLPLRRAICRRSRPFVTRVVSRSVSAAEVRERYLPRLFECYAWHRPPRERTRWSSSRRAFEDWLDGGLRAPSPGDRGAAGSDSPAALWLEVCLAQAMEHGEPRAIEQFESTYMPLVRRHAQSLGGRRAVEVVENLSADLILPRDHSPPRIAGFRGRKCLTSWLRVVATHLWLSDRRRRRESPLAPEMAPLCCDTDPGERLDNARCANLLQPLFESSVRQLEREQRAMLKLLILDGVSHQQLARALRIHPGTLTRRRDRAAAQILRTVRDCGARQQKSAQVSSCLELVLAGDDASLRRQLCVLLAREFKAGDDERDAGDDEPAAGRDEEQRHEP